MAGTDFQTENDELTINFKYMCLSMLKGWKTIFLWAMVGVVLGGAITLFKGDEANAFVNLDNVNVERTEQYASYLLSYNAQKKYEEESLLLKIDPTNAWEGSATYYITDPDGLDYTKLIYGAMKERSDFLERFIEYAGLTEYDQAYVLELFRCSTDIVSASKNVDFSEGKIRVKDVTESLTVQFSVIASDETRARQMLDAMTRSVDEFNLSFQTERPRMEAKLVYERFLNPAKSSWVSNARDNAISRRSELLDAMSALTQKSELNQDEKNYLKACFPQLSDEEVRHTALHYFKYSVLLGVLLACAACVWLACRYLFTQRLVFSEDVFAKTGLRVYGTLSARKKKLCGPDSWIDRLARRSEPPVNTPEYIVSALLSESNDRVLLCGDEGTREIREGLAALQPERILECGSLCSDAEAFAKLRECGSVVWLVRLGKTGQNTLRREIEICRAHQLKVMGAITLEA